MAHAPTFGPRVAASSLLVIPATQPPGPSVALRWLARMSREEQRSCCRGTRPGPPRVCSDNTRMLLNNVLSGLFSSDTNKLLNV